jgi:hypothetical protein
MLEVQEVSAMTLHPMVRTQWYLALAIVAAALFLLFWLVLPTTRVW